MTGLLKPILPSEAVVLKLSVKKALNSRKSNEGVEGFRTLAEEETAPEDIC